MFNHDDISPELKAKAEQCKTPEELLSLAESEGMELSEEELDTISGGWQPRCSEQDCLDGNCYSCKKQK